MLTNKKKSGVIILISNCRVESITRYKDSQFIIIKESIYREDRTILNVYAPNRASQYIKQKLTDIQEKIGKLAVTARHFNIFLSQ